MHQQLPFVRLKKLVIKSIHRQSKAFKTFVFENGHGISYKAGQYLTFIHQTPFEEIRRSYSIISSPALDEPLAIGVQRIPNGALSRALIDRGKPGDALLCTGAGGFFTLPDDPHQYRQLLFFAAGSGITPIFSLIKTAISEYRHLHLVLVYSSRSSNEIYFQKELDELRLRFPTRLSIIYFTSDSTDLKKARLTRELASQIVQEQVADLQKAFYYLCGPELYMHMCTFALQEMGVAPSQMKRENFAAAKKKRIEAVPPDVEPHCVSITTNGKTETFGVKYPDTILQAAKRQGINLPYSCEVGKCGSCAATCVTGKVWMSYNEVLTEKELAEGLVLTCTGFPISGDVVLHVS